MNNNLAENNEHLKLLKDQDISLNKSNMVYKDLVVHDIDISNENRKSCEPEVFYIKIHNHDYDKDIDNLYSENLQLELNKEDFNFLKNRFCIEENEVDELKFIDVIKLYWEDISDDNLRQCHNFPVLFDELFIEKTLCFIANQKTRCSVQIFKEVLRILLNKLDTPKMSEAPQIPEVPQITEEPKIIKGIKILSEGILKGAIIFENVLIDTFFIPSDCLNPIYNNEDNTLYKKLMTINEKKKNKTDQTIISLCTTGLNYIFLGGFIDIFSLASLATIEEMQFINEKITFNAFPLISHLNIKASVTLFFAITFVLIVFPFVSLCFFKYKKYKDIIKKINLIIFLFLCNGAFIEILIALFSYINCEYTEGTGYRIIKNGELECFSNFHIVSLALASILFITYYPFVLFFYPFIAKAYWNAEFHFNFEINGKVLYCIIYVFISNNYYNLKLVLSFFISVFLLIFWIFDAINYKYKKINQKTAEYSIIVLIYIISLILYNLGFLGPKFIILCLVVLLNFMINSLIYFIDYFKKRQNSIKTIPINEPCTQIQDNSMIFMRVNA